MKTRLEENCRRLARTKQHQKETLERLDAPELQDSWSSYADALRAVTGSVKLRTLSGEGSVTWEDGVEGPLNAAVIGGKAEQTRYQGYNRAELMGNPEGGDLQVDYDAQSGIFTINGAQRIPKNVVLSLGGQICWGDGTSFRMVREKLGGSVTLDGDNSGRYLLWSVFTKDYEKYTARTREVVGNTDQRIIYLPDGTGSAPIAQSPEGSGYRILMQVLGCSEERPTVFTDYRVRLMLVDQDQGIPTEYEPFTGGMAAPSPACPMPITVSEAAVLESADGSAAVAPRLCAIPETDVRDTWDAQSGQGVRRCAEILSYGGEEVTAPYVSSTGELSEGAHVIYAVPETSFETPPQPLTQTAGAGSVTQIGGNVARCPLSVTYRRQERLEERRTVSPVAEGLEIRPEEGFDAMEEVCITGDVNFKPWNIRSGVEIWGKTGTAAAEVST